MTEQEHNILRISPQLSRTNKESDTKFPKTFPRSLKQSLQEDTKFFAWICYFNKNVILITYFFSCWTSMIYQCTVDSDFLINGKWDCSGTLTVLQIFHQTQTVYSNLNETTAHLIVIL